jgi:urease accessory protein
MKAHASVVAEPGRYPTLRSDPPLTVRATTDGLHMVGSAAGPLGGDDLRFDLEVRDRTALTVRSVAAQLLYPGLTPSRSHVEVSVGEGATLEWRPQPLVAIRGADHRSTTRIRLAPTANLVWSEVVVLGRHDEDGGSVSSRLRVQRGSAALICLETRLGPAWPYAAGPAGTAGYRVFATTILVGTVSPEVVRVDRCAVCRVSDDVVVVTAVGHRVDDVAIATSRAQRSRG